MGWGDYLVGVLFLAGTWGCVGVAAWLILHRRLGRLVREVRVLAFATLAVALLIAVHLLPAVLGLLSRETVLIAAVMALLAASRVPSTGSATPSPAPEPLRPGGRLSWALGISAAVVVFVYVLAYTADFAAVEIIQEDTLYFHVPTAVNWMQSDTVWRVDQYSPDRANGNYPHNGDVLMLAAMLPWDSDAFVRIGNFLWWALAGFAVYALGRELRAPAPAALLAAALFAATPTVRRSGIEDVMTDPLMWAMFAAGATFLLRHCRTKATSDLVLAGIALGLSFGTKWYALSAIGVVLLVWAGTRLLADRSAKELLRLGAPLLGLVALAGGFWLVRNWVESSNPFYPAKVELLGITIFDAPRDLDRERIGFALSDYFDQPRLLWDEARVSIDVYLQSGGWLLILCALATVAAAALERLRGMRRLMGDPRIAPVALAAVLIALVYVFTPYSALSVEGHPILANAATRYVVPALILGAALAAWACGRLGRYGIALELLLAAAVIDAFSFAPSVSGRKIALVFLALAMAVGASILASHLWRRRSPLRVPLAAGTAAILAAVAVAAGHRVEERFIATRYVGKEPAFDWVFSRVPGGQRIGLAGLFNAEGLVPVQPLMGARLNNVLRYVGRFDQGTLREFRERGPFVRALQRGRYDLLVIGRGNKVPQPRVAEEAWARSVGFRQVTDSRRMALYRATD